MSVVIIEFILYLAETHILANDKLYSVWIPHDHKLYLMEVSSVIDTSQKAIYCKRNTGSGWKCSRTIDFSLTLIPSKVDKKVLKQSFFPENNRVTLVKTLFDRHKLYSC